MLIKTLIIYNLYMKSLLTFCLIFISTNILADLKIKLDQEIEELMPKIIEWRHDIHQYPELGNREFRTSKKIEEYMLLQLQPNTLVQVVKTTSMFVMVTSL